MRVFGVQLLADVDPATAPFWRQVLRGFSQCAFQAHEIAALFFIAAASFYNWRMGAFFVVSVFVATVAARWLGGNRTLLGLGLLGFNSGLMGLALGNFFVPNPAQALWVPILAAIVAAVTVAMSRWLPIPFLAAPFISMFWVLWFLADAMGLQKVDFGAFPDARVTPVLAIIAALGSTMFASGTLAGVLFFSGVLVSNWRHAVVALIGASVAVGVTAQVGVMGAAINSGFVGFNAVLAAVAAYALLAADLRLAVLAALIATWIFAFVTRTAHVPALASGFVLGVWAVQLLAWLNGRFNEKTDVASSGR